MPEIDRDMQAEKVAELSKKVEKVADLSKKVAAHLPHHIYVLDVNKHNEARRWCEDSLGKPSFYPVTQDWVDGRKWGFWGRGEFSFFAFACDTDAVVFMLVYGGVADPVKVFSNPEHAFQQVRTEFSFDVATRRARGGVEQWCAREFGPAALFHNADRTVSWTPARRWARIGWTYWFHREFDFRKFKRQFS